ncbi:MAG: hypothetical protein AAFU85_24405 [Planctomycetota bacterium]
MRLTAQIYSRGTAEAALSRSGERVVSDALAADDIDIIWLPHRSIVRRDAAGFSVDTTILLIAAGVAFASIVKPFVDAIAKEAGKDFWSVIKNVLGKTRAQQAEETYNISGNAYVLLEQGEDWVAIAVPMATTSRSDAVSPEDATHKLLDEYFALLANDWDEIQGKVQDFNIGQQRGYGKPQMSYMNKNPPDQNVVHLVRFERDRVTISPVPSDEFFGRGLYVK